MTLSMLGITPKVLQTHAKDGFLPRVEDCAKMINPKTKAIALVTPNNPVRTSVTFLIYINIVVKMLDWRYISAGVIVCIQETG